MITRVTPTQPVRQQPQQQQNKDKEKKKDKKKEKSFAETLDKEMNR